MSDDAATPAEAATYVASIALGLAMALEEPCGCGRPDCLDEKLAHPAVQGRLLQLLAPLVGMSCKADAELAQLTDTTQHREHPAGAAAWLHRTRQSLDVLHGEAPNRDRQEWYPAAWALARKAGGRVELSPRDVLEAGEPTNRVELWRDQARDVLVVRAYREGEQQRDDS